MPLHSMTGFARADGALEGVQWYWEMRAVNGKSLDVRCRLPYGMDGLEQKARAAVQRHVRRGNCQLSLQLTREKGAGEVKINEVALEKIVSVMEELGGRINAEPARLDGILAIKGILELAEPEETDEQRQALETALLKSLDELLVSMQEMRREEGARLQELLSGQVDAIEKLTISARDCPARTPEAIKARLAENVSRLIAASNTLDPDRLHQEAVLLATKADIQEELDRLFAHIEAARALFSTNEPVGRKLDFLTQEFNREANTLCSKSNDQALTTIGLELKSVVDQMREQVQNIE
ncbi:MAG: YicC/YloC family endoribonuclease [Hyphomicrobiales bacterium]